MPFRLAFLLFPLALLGNADHASQNPVYQDLRLNGVPVGVAAPAKLPEPTMADGLTAAQQRQVIEALAGQDYRVDELLRQSIVAPQVLKIRTDVPSDPMNPARGVDVWFVAYGDLDTIGNKKFLENLLSANRKDSQGADVPTAELAKRGITVPAGRADREGYGHAEFTFLDLVQIHATGHSCWTRTPDSILLATRVDPRFRDDPQYPNRWQPLRRGSSGKLEKGAAQPYEGVGYYMKITRLHEPQGALFVEGHVLFTEPYGWFDGKNLLRSKLPPVVQDRVRTMRRELLKAAQK